MFARVSQRRRDLTKYGFFHSSSFAVGKHSEEQEKNNRDSFARRFTGFEQEQDIHRVTLKVKSTCRPKVLTFLLGQDFSASRILGVSQIFSLSNKEVGTEISDFLQQPD